MRIGKNAEENWEIFDQADPEDVWVHLNAFPSPHVIVPEDDVCRESLLKAAEECKSRSKYRNIRNMKAVYCKVKHLKKGDDPGEIIILSKKKCGFVKL